jgi:hypothetical protein
LPWMANITLSLQMLTSSSLSIWAKHCADWLRLIREVKVSDSERCWVTHCVSIYPSFFCASISSICKVFPIIANSLCGFTT